MVANYSDVQKANALAALAANGGNVNRTARELGIPWSTLKGWCRPDSAPGVAELREEQKRDLPAKLQEVAWKLAGAIEGKIDAASLQHTAVALGIVIDKLQLLQGKPTSITDDRTATDAELDRELATALAAARESLATGATVPVEPPCSS
jgi:transposase-like protein